MVDDVLRAPYAGVAGSRSGALALLRGIAESLRFEADSAVDEGTMQSLVIVLAETLDAIDMLEADACTCSCPPVEADPPCPLHGVDG